ncbi:hypothetical protein [Cellulomonas sp. NTE-D12]|uniref:hypothetical protein n=1 Tax=Cellulomonas sp. NTE-D12 TaxID=2962632 RepID=UPI00308168A2|nr:hypothetical protein CELD12_26340 [Cellulomonas sp. NTE-D12]
MDNTVRFLTLSEYYPRLSPLMRVLDLDPDNADDVLGFAYALSAIRVVSDQPNGDAYEAVVEGLRDLGTCVASRADEYTG